MGFARVCREREKRNYVRQPYVSNEKNSRTVAPGDDMLL
jgi:hypothetical protein